MAFRIPAKYVLYGSILTAAMFFQNCSDVSDSNSMSSSLSAQETLPFAYNATIDTIAYMSCSNLASSGYNPRAYFTFRAGAYNPATGGLAMTPAFFSSTQYYTPTNRGAALSHSLYDNSIMLNLSIRNGSNYQNMWATSTPTSGLDMDVFLPQLDGDLVAGQLASLTNTNIKQNYFPGNSDQRLMEASLRFFNNEADASNTRNQIGSNASMLIVGYTSTADPADQKLRSPIDFVNEVPNQTTTYASSASAANTVYGTGYLMNFSLPAGYSTGDRRVLSTSIGITEKNLQTGQAQASTWNCNSGYQFMIIRPEDVASGKVNCKATVDNTANATQAAQLTAIRRVLRVEDWYVDLNNHCVIPKGTGDYCYGAGEDTVASGTTQPLVEYGTTACTDSATYLCPHFVSVCVRQ